MRTSISIRLIVTLFLISGCASGQNLDAIAEKSNCRTDITYSNILDILDNCESSSPEYEIAMEKYSTKRFCERYPEEIIGHSLFLKKYWNGEVSDTEVRLKTGRDYFMVADLVFDSSGWLRSYRDDINFTDSSSREWFNELIRATGDYDKAIMRDAARNTIFERLARVESLIADVASAEYPEILSLCN